MWPATPGGRSTTRRIGFAGDLVPGRRIDGRRRRPDAVCGDLRDRLRNLDGLFVDLHPTVIGDCRVHRVEGDVARWCRERLRDRSAPFGTTVVRVGEALLLDV